MHSLPLFSALYLLPAVAVAFALPSTITDHDVSDPASSSTPSPPDDDDSSELQNWSSLIGIITAIVGNALIALALNVQRYAHIRLQKRRIWARERAKQALKHSQNGSAGYGTIGSNGQTDAAGLEAAGHREHNNFHDPHDSHDSHHSDPLSQSIQSDASNDDPKVTSTYLKDPYWWMGQVLITVGETGNFLAYGFAPASIVSPLGVVTLISNCIVAPMIFHERFRARDFWGVVVAIMGAVTVVLSANQKETKLGPHDVWGAITTMEFEIYMGVSAALICLLIWLSRKYGHRTILIDLGLVGLFGAYTALSTKGISSMLSSTFLGAFATPVTYGLIAVLVFTAIMQIRYLNKALQRFDSTQVIPIQFVLFTLSVILGSAVLYRDFESTTLEQAIKFVGGCLLTFFGVFLITSGRPQADDDEEHLSDIDGIEETLHLSEQNSAQRPTPISIHPDHVHQQAMTSSRRSSKSSKVPFIEAMAKPFASLRNRDPSPPRPHGSQRNPARMSLEDTPLLDSPWEDADNEPASRPLMQRHGPSADSVLTLSSPESPVAFHLATEPVTLRNGIAGSYSAPNVALQDRPVARPVTPTRAAGTLHRHHPSHLTLINPSPLSSTVSAVISESLLRGTESPGLRRTSVRRSRPSLRTSLFVPSDEFEEGGPLMGPAILGSDESATLRTSMEREDPGQDEDDSESSNESEHKGLRSRARSLSNSIGELLGVSRLIRRNTSPDVNSPRGEQGSGG